MRIRSTPPAVKDTLGISGYLKDRSGFVLP
jgi:hypothetical protein